MSKLICANCGEAIEKEQAVFVDGDYYCTECKHCEDGLVACDVCGVLHSADNVIEINGKNICVDCLEDSDEYAKCYECGEWHCKDDMIWCDDTQEYYCEECADDELFWCECCEEYHSRSYHDIVTVYDRCGEETWCYEAARDNAQYCSNCDEWFDDGVNGGYTRDGEWVCDSCIEDSFRYCDECRSYVHEDNWDYDYDCCQWCAEENHSGLIRDYHCGPEIKFYGKLAPSWRGEFQGIGVEVEIDRDEHDGVDECNLVNALIELCPDDEIYFEHDSSLRNGFEIITQPHTLTAFYEMPWQKILDTCRAHGYEAHDIGTCGLHMHISRNFFGRTREVQDIAIAKLMQFYELYYEEILKVSRRTREQAMSWAANYGICDKDFLMEKSKGRAGHHGIAINNSNYDTVEIRLTRGTLNYKTFMACIDFMVTACRNSRTIGWSKTTDATRWLNGIEEETYNYLCERRAFVWCRHKINVKRESCDAQADEQLLWNDHSIRCTRPCSNDLCLHHRCGMTEPERAVHIFAGCDRGYMTRYDRNEGPISREFESELIDQAVRDGRLVV